MHRAPHRRAIYMRSLLGVEEAKHDFSLSLYIYIYI